MSIDSSVADLLAGGAPSFKFDEIGKTVKGKVVSATAAQQTDFDSGELLFWDDGKPRMQLVITLDTDERDPNIDGDDGHRRIFAKGAMLSAIRKALNGAEMQVGGTLAVKYTEDGEAKRKGMSPPKLFVAQYQAPVATVDADGLI